MSNQPFEDSIHGSQVALSDLTAFDLELSPDDVHLWHAALDSYSADNLQDVLSEDEVIRANRFHFAKDRNHFTIARALLRKLLARYLGTNHQLRIACEEMGKPFVAGDETPSITFNLAHSGGRALYAFSRGREVGVDLEFIREDMTGDDIASRYFSDCEISALQAVPSELRQEAFFNCWTRKEAYIKARGEGLSMPLNSFDVSLKPGETPTLLKNHTDQAEVARWEMRAIPVAPGYVAALVVEGHGWRLKTYELVQTFRLS